MFLESGVSSDPDGCLLEKIESASKDMLIGLPTFGYFNFLLKFFRPRADEAELFRDFMDSAGQFQRVLEDSGLVKLRRLADNDLAGTLIHPGILEQYCFLISADDQPVLKDIHFKDELRIGDNRCQLYSLADAEDLPAQRQR